MLIQFARNYEILGDSEKQRTRASEAHSLLASLAAEKPGDTSYQADLAAVLREVGDALLTQGKLAEALQAYSAALAIRRRLTEADPANTPWTRDVGAAV